MELGLILAVAGIVVTVAVALTIYFIERSRRKKEREADQRKIHELRGKVEEGVKALEGKVPEIYLAGDGVEPRSIVEAISDGSRIARAI